MPEALKTTLRCDHLLEGLTGPRNVVILCNMVYYSKRIQIKVSKGNRCIGWSLGTLEQLQASSFPPTGVTDRYEFTQQWHVTDNTGKVLSTRETHPCLGIQVFWGRRSMGRSVTQASRACVTDLSYLVFSSSTSPNRRSIWKDVSQSPGI